MVDLLLLNTILNVIWYISTVLFLLYRFTSLFSYGYNFLKFCGKIWIGVCWVKDKTVSFIKRDELHIQPVNNKTIYQKFRNKCKKVYNYFYPKKDNLFPMYSSNRESYVQNYIDNDNDNYFENEMSKLIREENESSSFSIGNTKNYKIPSYLINYENSTTVDYYNPFYESNTSNTTNESSDNQHNIIFECDEKPLVNYNTI